MIPIRWACISDLHLGALNSVLTNVSADGERVDASVPSPVLTALCECLRSLGQSGQEPPQLIVLGDLFELALTAPEDAAATFSQFVQALRPGLADGAIAPTMRFVPGNHDHHLWSRASSDRYLRQLEEDTAAVPSPLDRHATHLLPANDRVPVRDRFIEILARRGQPGCSITVEQSYPNLGLVTQDGKRAVVLSHGHFIEPLYRSMSLLDTVFGSPRAGAVEAWQLEADNGGWIDFFWSSMGDSGDIMRVTRSLYESLQSHEAMHAEISAIERAIKASGRSRLEADAVAQLLRAGIGTAVRERHRPGTILSPHAEAGLLTYLNGAVATQIAAEVGHPDDVTFIFGHTHKPFVEQRTASAFPTPVNVINTGGWVVDTPERNPVKGAAMIVIDEQLNVAALRCYTEGPDAASYRVRIDPAGASGSNDLVDELRASIDPDRDPWAQLAHLTQTVVADRGRQLVDRQNSDTSMLNELNLKAEADEDAK
jgi:UDP-2,3-diacylglucosamine pyrophosphatase LpxH